MNLKYLGLCCALVSSGVSAGPVSELFIDPEDGFFDASRFLLEYDYSFLPVPFAITEPAIGEGGGLALAFFHDNMANASTDAEFLEPSITAIVGGYTNNGSKFTGVGHFGKYRRDTVHYDGIFGYASLNLTFYGIAGIEQGVPLKSEGTFNSHELTFRLQDSNWFAGFNFEYMNIRNSLAIDVQDYPGVEEDHIDSTNTALGLVLEYDSRDNSNSPTKGIYSKLNYERYNTGVGGDFNYAQFTVESEAHWSLTDKWVFGVSNFISSVSDGEPPFYAVPYIELRGIPAMRFQGNHIVSVEAQVNWKFHPRFHLSLFSGVGRAAGVFSDLSNAPSRTTTGLGFRYLAARVLGLTAGLDFAWGPEDTVTYIGFGSTFH